MLAENIRHTCEGSPGVWRWQHQCMTYPVICLTKRMVHMGLNRDSQKHANGQSWTIIAMGVERWTDRSDEDAEVSTIDDPLLIHALMSQSSTSHQAFTPLEHITSSTQLP